MNDDSKTQALAAASFIMNDDSKDEELRHHQLFIDATISPALDDFNAGKARAISCKKMLLQKLGNGKRRRMPEVAPFEFTDVPLVPWPWMLNGLDTLCLKKFVRWWIGVGIPILPQVELRYAHQVVVCGDIIYKGIDADLDTVGGWWSRTQRIFKEMRRILRFHKLPSKPPALYHSPPLPVWSKEGRHSASLHHNLVMWWHEHKVAVTKRYEEMARAREKAQPLSCSEAIFDKMIAVTSNDFGIGKTSEWVEFQVEWKPIWITTRQAKLDELMLLVKVWEKRARDRNMAKKMKKKSKGMCEVCGDGLKKVLRRVEM